MTDDPAFPRAADGSGVRTVAVAGLGLIGGSVARELAARGVRVLGYDRDPAAAEAARGDGTLAAVLGEDFAGAEEADVFLVAVPVLAARAVLQAARPRLGAVRLVTDAGSTKRSIAAAAEEMGIGDRFVGSHPLAGDHRSGWSASRAGLFAGARVFLCPTDRTGDEALSLARALWTLVGGVPEVVSAEEHDRRLAWASHLPQALSSALAAALDVRGVARAELGPGGRDVTRLAGSSPEMWTEILRDNADAVAEALAAVEAEVRGMREAVEADDVDRLRALFAAAQAWHQRGENPGAGG